MKYNIEKLDNGIELVHVDNELNLKATLASYGAGVYELSYKDRPVILELADFSDYMHSSILAIICILPPFMVRL